MNDRNGVRALSTALELSDSNPDPASLALLIAAEHYADLDIGKYTARIDDLAKRAQNYMGRSRGPLRAVGAMNRVLFEEEGFSGNTEDYYSPANSFLNEVLDRKLGIPISLSVVYLSVAWRLKQPIYGVGLPLHFIVKHVTDAGEIYIDPFNRGSLLTIEECQQLVERAAGAPVNFQSTYLDAVPIRLILYRMLNNLKMIFVKREDYSKAGTIVEQMLEVQPDAVEELRDRGLLYLRERRYSGAAEYLGRYLVKCPEAPDAATIRIQLERVFARRAQRN